MWKYLIGIICILNASSLCECTPIKKKAKKYEIYARRTEFEKRHFNDYMNNEETYTKWPEALQNPESNCQKFLKKIFPYSAKRVDTAIKCIKFQSHAVMLNYAHINNTNGAALSPVKVIVLECPYPNPRPGPQKYIYFTRSPLFPRCALILNRVVRTTSKFYIADEVCEYRNYYSFWKTMAQINEIDIATSLQLKKEDYLPRLDQDEMCHFQQYLLETEKFKHWPELKEKGEKTCCQMLFKSMFPKKCKKMITVPDTRTVFLKYSKIQSTNVGLHELEVKSLICHLLNRSRRNKFVFIRAPKPECVYRVRRKYVRCKHYFIMREICGFETGKDRISENKLESVTIDNNDSDVELRGQEYLISNNDEKGLTIEDDLETNVDEWFTNPYNSDHMSYAETTDCDYLKSNNENVYKIQVKSPLNNEENLTNQSQLITDVKYEQIDEHQFEHGLKNETPLQCKDDGSLTIQIWSKSNVHTVRPDEHTKIKWETYSPYDEKSINIDFLYDSDSSM